MSKFVEFEDASGGSIFVNPAWVASVANGGLMDVIDPQTGKISEVESSWIYGPSVSTWVQGSPRQVMEKLR